MKKFLAVLCAALLFAAPVNAAVTAASLGSHVGNSATTNTLTTATNNCAAGSTIILGFTSPSSATLSSVTDSSSNTWQTPIDVQTATGVTVAFAYAVNIASAVNTGATIVANLSSSAGSLVGAICVQNLHATTPLDIHGVTTTGSGTSSGGVSTGTLNDSNEIIMGVAGFATAQGTSTCAGSFTSFAVNSGAPADGRICYLIVSSSSSVNFVPTWTNNVTYLIDVATFDTNGGSTPTVTNKSKMLLGVGQ